MLLETFHSLGVFALLVATVLPMSNAPFWWIRTLDFPRLQFFVLALLLIAMQLVFCDYQPILHYSLLAVSGVIAAYHFSWILPYTPLAPLEVKWSDFDRDSETIKILCANVLTPNRDSESLMKLIASCEPDVVLTVETNLWWQDQLEPIEKDYTHCVKWPLENLFGMHLYSRLPLHEVEACYLIEDGIPSIHCEVELESGRRVLCHFLHPTPPVPEYAATSTGRDAELIVVAKSVADENRPVIVAGDLNDVAWSTTTRLFRKLSGLCDPRIGRGLFNTFHAQYWPIRWPLDHLFHSNHFTLRNLKRLPYFGSDHFALFTELTLEHQQKEDPPLQPTPEDEKLAEERTREAGVEVKDVPGQN